ncbi:hypothetical protein LJB99_00330 [Deltaproteobacteria bacterium OttesenSCG-928-K17]|nr:hypothetical protein [Deltaproteobacteria bacterium OttesenSCG-928-K17]
MVLSNLRTPEEFDDALRKGLGRAVGHVRAASAEAVWTQLLHACTNYLGFDLQCEGSRAPWLYEMIALTGEADRYCAEVLKSLEMINGFLEDSRSLYEMANLLAVFVQKGRPELRDVLLRKVFSFDAPNDVFGDGLPIEVLGVDGAVEVLRRYSRSGFTSFCLGNYFFDEAFEAFGASLTEALKAAGRGDAALGAYLREMEAERRQEAEDISQEASPAEERPPFWESEERLFSLLDSLPPESYFLSDLSPNKGRICDCKGEYITLRSMFRVAGKNHQRIEPPGFLDRVFTRLMAESDSGKLFCLLGTFAQTAMPRFEPSILALVDSPVGVLSLEAVQALSNISAPEIRAKGRQLLEAGAVREDWANGFSLFTESGRAEDLPLIIGALADVPAHSMDPDDLHAIVRDVIPLARIGEPIDAAPIMLWVYENSPCANCRGESVSWLVGNQAAPDELLAECLDDCDEHIRQIALEARK